MPQRRKATSCRNGHPYVDGSYTFHQGFRRCKACTKASKLRWQKAHPEKQLAIKRGLNERWRKKNRETARASNARWADQARVEGRLYNGFTANVVMATGKNLIAEALEAVRREGKMRAGATVIGSTRRWGAIRFFNKAIGERADKLLLAAPRQRVISAPAISFRREGSAEEFVSFVDSIIPRTLTRDMRDDVIGEMIFAMIEGRLKKKDAVGAVKSFISKRFASFHNKWGDLSIDELRGDDEGISFLDLIPDTQRMWA